MYLVEAKNNENSNKLIRGFIPKRTDIGRISKEKIKYIENRMNRRDVVELHLIEGGVLEETLSVIIPSVETKVCRLS